MVVGMNWWQRLTPLAVAILILGAAAAEVGGSGNSPDQRAGAAMLWGVGFVFLGAWLTLEIWHWQDDETRKSKSVSRRTDERNDGEDEGTT